MLFLIAWGSPSTYGQTVAGTVAVGANPYAVAVNPVTDKVYVANSAASGTVTEINEATNTTNTITVGSNPYAVAVNPVTDLVYVANYGSNTVTVIDGATDTVAATVAVGTGPHAVAVNPVTDKIYVPNILSRSVTVIDGATNTTSTVTAGQNPYGIAVNPVTDTIYVTDFGNSSVTVIDGATNNTSTVSAGSGAYAVVVNPVTDEVYVANYAGNSVTVIDGATDAASTLNVGSAPIVLAADPVTNKVYVANANSNSVTVIDGATNSTSTVSVGSSPAAVAVNQVTNMVYVANEAGNDVTVIDGATNSTTTLTAGAAPRAVAVNPVTNKVYVANYNSSSVTEIDGATNRTSAVSVGSLTSAVATDPVTDKVYVASVSSGSVTAIDGATNSTSTVTVGSNPDAVAVNPVTNKIYVANDSSNTVTVIDGASQTTSTVAVGPMPVALAVNLVTNKVYVANLNGDTVTVIDGATNSTSTVAVGSNPDAVAVDPVTNKVYVANESSNNMTVIDGATNSTSTVTVGTNPAAVAVDPVTDKVYVVNRSSDTVTVIDGTTNSTSTASVGSNPVALAVNRVTNTVYVANWNSATVTAIDGATNSTSTVTVGTNPAALAVNPVTNKVYVVNRNSSTVTVIDGATNSTSAVAVGTNPSSLAVNPVTGKVYVPNPYSTTVTVIDASNIQPVPITMTAIGVTDSLTTGTSNNVFQTMNTAPQFTVNVDSAYSSNIIYSGLTATNPPPTALYYSVDGGQWSAAMDSSTTGSNPASFSITLGQQSLGLHTLYYFAAYGHEGGQNSAGNGTGESPEISNLAASHFLVQPISTSTSLIADVNPQNAGSNVTLTATVAPLTNSGTLTGNVQFYDGTTPLGVPVTVQNSGGVYQATYSTSSLTAGTHTINAIYSGDASDGSSSGSMTEQIAGTAATLAAVSGGRQSAAVGTAFTNPLVVKVTDSNGIAVPGGTVNFSGAGLSFNPATASTGSNGEVRTTVTPTQSGALTGIAALSGATSATFDETGIPLSATVQVEPASTVYGTATTLLTATVAYSGTTVPTGAVTFTVNGGTSVPGSCKGSSSPLTCTASYPSAGLSVSGGPYSLVARLAADTNYVAVSASGTLVVTPAPLIVTANNATRAYGTANPAFTGTVTGAANGNSFTESMTTRATATSSVGPYSIVPSVTGANLSNYTVITVDGTLVISQAGSAVSLTSSTLNANLNAGVAFTAKVTSATTGTPTGSVEFLDGSTVLGSVQLNNTDTATYTVSNLAAGLHQITAVYRGDVNFDESASAPLAQLVTAPDFEMTTNVNTLTLKQGQTGDVTISLDPMGGFTGAVQFTCGGLPANSQCAFSPTSLTADGSNTRQTDQMTITTKGPNTGTVAMLHPGELDGAMLAGIFWLPGLVFGGFLFWQRKKLMAKYRMLLVLMIAAAVISGVVGCGSASPHTAPGASLVTVTATSGSTTHTATIYLMTQ